MKTKIFISKNDDIQKIMDSLPTDSNENVSIYIEPGTYYGRVTIKRSNITIIGQGEHPEDTVITFDAYALQDYGDGTKRGTFRSYTMLIDANDVTLQNLTLENSSGDALTHGQALALYADGDRLVFDNCRFTSEQDTVFTGPLPAKEAKPGGFVGPKEFAPRINGRQFFHNCYIRGNVDFIFGSATAYFKSCTIESVRHYHNSDACVTLPASLSGNPSANTGIEGYVTAPSTPEGQKYGYVFSNCKLISKDCPPESVYLGRPWRPFAKSVFIECDFGAHINKQGFCRWKKDMDPSDTFFAEAGNTQCGQSFFGSFECERRLPSTELKDYTIQAVLAGDDNWISDIWSEMACNN